ncbi:MAG: amidohydrolase family protein [candidate division WOR-3 bacterium]
MIKRRDVLKSAMAIAGSNFLRPIQALALRNPAAESRKMDFQTFLPRHFDGKPFGPAELTALEDEAGIDRFVVFPETTSRPDNAALAEAIKSRPRMIGGASINPTLGSESVKALETAIRDLGLKGVRLSPAVHRYPIDAEIVFPLMEKAQTLDIPVTIDADVEFCKPSQIAVVAGRFPRLRIILDMGFRAPVRPPGEPAGKEMAETVARCPNLYLGLTALTTCQPAYLMSTIWVGGPERVLFGSNAPSGIPLFAVKGITWAALGKEAESLIFEKNLKKIYKLG